MTKAPGQNIGKDMEKKGGMDQKKKNTDFPFRYTMSDGTIGAFKNLDEVRQHNIDNPENKTGEPLN